MTSLHSEPEFLVLAGIPADLVYQQCGDRLGKKEFKNLGTCYRIDLNEAHISPLQGFPLINLRQGGKGYAFSAWFMTPYLAGEKYRGQVTAKRLSHLSFDYRLYDERAGA